MSSDDHAPPFPGSLAGRFSPHGVIGTGAFGTVFRAQDRELGRPVAIKLLRVSEEAARVRLKREAEVLMGLRHPGVVSLFDHGEVPEGAYLVLELIEGRSFEAVPPIRPLVAMRQVAEALEAVHEAGVVHRDVKPDNLIATPEGRVVLVDFGLVRDTSRTAATATGKLVGTPAYMAPEVLCGHPAGPAADWYGWGVSLYRFIEGRLPYESEEILAMVRGGNPGPPKLRDVDSEAARCAAAALLQDPAARVAAMVELGMASTAAPSPVHRRDTRRPVESGAARASSALPPLRPSGGPFLVRVTGVFLASVLAGWMVLGRGDPGQTPAATASALGAARPELLELREAVGRLVDDHRGPAGTFSFGSRGGTPDDHMLEMRKEYADGRIVGRIRRVLEKAQAYLSVASPEEAARGLGDDLSLGLVHMGVDEDMVASDIFSPHILGRPTGQEEELSDVRSGGISTGSRNTDLLKARLAEIRALKSEYQELGAGVPGLAGARLRAWALNLQPGEVRERATREILEESSRSPPEVALQMVCLTSLIGPHALDMGTDSLPCGVVRAALDGLEEALRRAPEASPVQRAEAASLLTVDGMSYLMSCARESSPDVVAQVYLGLDIVTAEAARPGGLEATAGNVLWQMEATALLPSLGGRLLISDRDQLRDAFLRSKDLADRMRAHFGAAPLDAYRITNSTIETLLGRGGL